MINLVRSSIFSALLMTSSAGLSFLMFMYLARVLGAAEYGLFASMFALGTIGAISALFGQQTLSMKTLSALADEPDVIPQRRRSLRQSYQVAFSGAAIVVVLSLGVGLGATALGNDMDLRHLVGACALVFPLAMADLIAHQFRAFGAIFWALGPRDIFWRGGIVLACFAAASLPFVFTNALTTVVVLSLSLMVIVGIQATAMLISNRALLLPRPQSGSVTKMQWRTSMWMWFASLGNMGASLNISGAAMFLPPEQIGAYFAAQKISQLLQLPIIAVNISATPVFARLHKQSDLTGLRNVGQKLAMLISVPLAIGAIVVGLIAPELLGLFDPVFVDASAALTLLAASYLVIGLGGPTRQLMLMSDGERQVVRLTVVSEVIGLILIPILVPPFGIIGAALSACVARLLFTVMSVSWCRKNLSVDTSILSLVPYFSVSKQ
ncbi:MAG: polysaccharide biosynthesis C-terminal domain-containing protein [Roseobacter sp.]